MRIMSTAAAAVLRQTGRLEASAARVAKLGNKPVNGEKAPDIVNEAVLRIEAGASVKANLSVIKSEDERLNALLDILA